LFFSGPTAALASYRYDAGAVFNVAWRPLRSGDLAHRAVKAHSHYLDKEVDGIASQVALGPAPVAFLDEEAGEGVKVKGSGRTIDSFHRFLPRFTQNVTLLTGIGQSRRIAYFFDSISCRHWPRTPRRTKSPGKYAVLRDPLL